MLNSKSKANILMIVVGAMILITSISMAFLFIPRERHTDPRIQAVEQQVDELNIQFSKSSTEKYKLTELVSILGTNLTVEQISKYQLKEKVPSDRERYVGYFLQNNQGTKVYTSAFENDFTVIANGANKIVQIALGSDYHGWLGLPNETFSNLTSKKETMASSNAYQEDFYPELGINIVSSLIGGKRVVIGINLLYPFASYEDFKNQFEEGQFASMLFKTYSFR